MSRIVVAVLLAAVLALPVSAQESVWISGRVLDAASGGGVAGARVQVEGPHRMTVLTRADGAWRLGPFPVGDYTLEVSHIGYAAVERSVGVPVQGGGVEVLLTPRPMSLESLVVTAGRRLQRLADVPVSTEVVSSREIRETGASDLGSVLTERTGIELEGGHPVGAGVMIQGMGSERVLVLLDGQPFIGRISGMVDVSRIPTSMIERVEVVKGPQSTLYGSEAMGGVVNVITRSSGEAAWSTQATVAAGSQGRLDLGGSAMGAAGPLTGLVDLGRRTVELTPGWSARSGAVSERWDGLAKLGWRAPVPGLSVEASGVWLDERQRWRSGQLFHFADNTQRSARIGAVLERGRHRFTPNIYVTAFDHLSRQATSEEPVRGSGEAEVQRLAEGELLYGVALGDHALDLGIEAREEAIRSDRVTGGQRTERTLDLFAQSSLNLGPFIVVPGLRATHSDAWGTHWTPRIATMYRPVPAIAVRLSAGEGFRAPGFKERYMEFLNVGAGSGYAVRGNPELRPEVSRNLTASVEWAGARTYLRLQAFENRFDRFIETRPVGDSSGLTMYTYGNVDDGFTRGGEVEAGVTWEGWRLEAGYNRLRAEHAETGEPLLGRPSDSSRGTLGYARPDGFRLAVTGVYTGRTAMSRTEAGTQWRDGFLRFDMRAALQVADGLELTAGVDNILDDRPAQWPGYTGRHIYTAISWRANGERADNTTGGRD